MYLYWISKVKYFCDPRFIELILLLAEEFVQNFKSLNHFLFTLEKNILWQSVNI
jgi:hypothetical protein